MTSNFHFPILLKELNIDFNVFPKSLQHYDGIRIESALHYIFDSFQPIINPVLYEDYFPTIFQKYNTAADVMLEIYMKKKLLKRNFFVKYGKYLCKPLFAQHLQTLSDEYLNMFLSSYFNSEISVLGINKKLIFLLIARDFVEETEEIYRKKETELRPYLLEFIEHALYHKNIALLMFFYEENEHVEGTENYNPWSLHHFNSFDNFKQPNQKGEYMWKLCYEYLLSRKKQMKTRDVYKWLKYMRNKEDVKYIFDVFFAWKKPTIEEFIKIFSKHVSSYDNLNLLINKYYTSEEIIKGFLN